MPVVVKYNNADDCVLRPSPLVSISANSTKTGAGEAIGASYSITLTGSILDNMGFPLARKTTDNSLFGYIDGGEAISEDNMIGPYQSFDRTTSNFTTETGGVISDQRPRTQAIPQVHSLDAIFFKQKVLRSLFGRDGQRVEIIPIHGDEPAVICFPRVVSISFSEGVYVNKCDYTIELEADTLLDKDLKVDHDGSPSFLSDPLASGLTTEGIFASSGYFVASISDSWSLEADDTLGEAGDQLSKSYRISHSMSATGKNHSYPTDTGVVTKPAWENARDYVQAKLMPPQIGSSATIASYPNVMGRIGSGTLNLISAYQGFNHTRTEEVNVSDGTYSVTENWLLASGTAYENYNLSISSDTSAPFVSVNIDGSIKGLTSSSPSGNMFGGMGGSGMNTAYQNALKKYKTVTNNGLFGFTSSAYKRANESVAVELNATPKSISLATNEYDGTVTYNLAFDNRPVNMISGVLSENISINDTYPGDVFAQIQVLGRKTGPILQYIGGRTEYKRDLNMELVMDYTDIPYGSGRTSLILTKPSLVEPTATQIRQVIESVSPQNEPGIRKYFIAPPSESWTPKEGRYSFNISWTYELDK